MAESLYTFNDGGVKSMKKTHWKYLVDTFLFLSLVGIVLIGILLGFFLPKGPRVPESSKYFLDLHRHQWGNIHFYLALAFIALVILHLILEWDWVKAQARKIFKKNWASALISTAVASLLVIFLFWLFYPKTPGAYEDYGVRAGRGAQAEALEEQTFPEQEKYLIGEGSEAIVITGQMTLQDVENATGIDSHKIITALGLPPNVARDEHLGGLRKRYGFSLQEFRDLVAELLQEKAVPPEAREEDKKISEQPEAQKQEEPESEEHEEKLTRGRLAEDTSSVLITGRMTLSEIETQTGIPARVIVQKLGLPADVPRDETLGRLRRRYSFTMQEVRDIVASLLKKD